MNSVSEIMPECLIMLVYVTRISVQVSDTIRIGYADTHFPKKNTNIGIRLGQLIIINKYYIDIQQVKFYS